MSRYDGATIEVINWERFNGRKDVKNPSWFKFSHSFFEDPDFYDFSHDEVVAWIYIMCLASKKSCSRVRLVWAHAARIGRLDPEYFDSAVQKLIKIGCIEVHVTDTLRARNADVTDACAREDKIREEEIREDERRTHANVTHSTDPKRALSEENLTRARDAWFESLRKFGAGRANLLPAEDVSLGSAIQRHGVVAVEMACLGFRCQKPSDRFNPAEWVDIHRVFKPDNFMRFVNAGVAEANRKAGAA